VAGGCRLGNCLLGQNACLSRLKSNESVKFTGLAGNPALEKEALLPGTRQTRSEKQFIDGGRVALSDFISA
jgi:hypothetical protein